MRFDFTVNAGLYRAGIAEYWVADVAGRRLVVHREPANGVYGSVESFTEHESVAPLGLPGQTIGVAAMFGRLPS